MTHLVWFRNDLRLDDNPALYHACHHARSEGKPVRAIYCATPEQWHIHSEAPAKLALRSDALQNLQRQLASLGIALDTLQVPLFGDLPSAIANYCGQHSICELWFNRELFINEQQRDQAVVQTLKSAGIPCQSFCNELLLPEPIVNGQGGYYRVFTPWYKAWLMQLQRQFTEPLAVPEVVAEPLPIPEPVKPLPGAAPNYRDDLWPGSEAAARQKLAAFCHRLPTYSDARDYPAMNGTSTLSPYLASGLLGVRRCLQWIQQNAFEQGWDWRESVWLRELCWREFYRYLMVCFPYLGKNQPFRTAMAQVQWLHDPQQIAAWQQGQTGFPIIDAAMRQLQQTGWMHNRLRMLSASFFCKLMLHDWRVGEQFFMATLLDGDFASNNGGWQWSSSTGCDASPWFRIFNPEKQSQKFDSEGAFIRKFVPELASLDSRQIHNPDAAVRDRLGYPQPLLDYRLARQRALDFFK
ncbi:deoxyribodipyrimidine photo-lyase [Porticoccus sp. GXU_MW_L64]